MDALEYGNDIGHTGEQLCEYRELSGFNGPVFWNLFQFDEANISAGMEAGAGTVNINLFFISSIINSIDEIMFCYLIGKTQKKFN